MNEAQDLAGFLILNKPQSKSSHHSLGHLKYILGKGVKVGHSGTLDFFATGILIAMIGRPATRYMQRLMMLNKSYTATGKLGQLTDTLDFTGTLLEEKEATVTEKDLQQAITSFGVSYIQTPPIYSALKFKGLPLSKIASKQRLSQEELEQVVKTKQREVNLYNLELTDFNFPFFTIKAHVSHGTYIRVLVDDIAQKVDARATTHELTRTQVGPFTLNDAHTLDTFKTLDDIKKHLISVEQMEQLLTDAQQ